MKYKVLSLITVFHLFLISLGAQEINNAGFSEKAWLQTDRNIFIAGENLYFNLYINAKPVNKSNYAYLVLRNRQNARVYGIRLKLTNSMASGSLYLPDTLSTGPYQLVAYTNCMRNIGEESYFTREIFIANRFDNNLSNLWQQYKNDAVSHTTGAISENSHITLSSDKPKYHKREKVTIEIGLDDSKLKSLHNISISVHKKEPAINEQYVTGSNPGQPITSDCFYLPETNGTIISGRLIATSDKKPLLNKIIYLSAQDSVANMQFTQTDKDGKFQFLLKDYYANKQLYFRAPDSPDSKFEIDDKYDIKKPFNPSVRYSVSELIDYLAKNQNIVTIQKNYHVNLKNEQPIPLSKTDKSPRLYFKPFYTTYPSDFVKLNDFLEISKELLLISKIRKNDNKYVLNLWDHDNKDFFPESPLIFLDGVPIDDVNQIIPLNSNKIKKIETIGESRYYGGMVFPGIMSVFSREKELENIQWLSPTFLMKMEPSCPTAAFCPPDYSKTNLPAYIPDFRQLLYWEPSTSIKSDEKKHIEFYTSDNAGDYTIDVNGFTASGNSVNTSATFTILSN